MISVTQAFLNAWNNRTKKFVVRQVKYKRRYWNGSALVWETDWKTLYMRDFRSIGNITQQLDTVKLNEFRTSNLTLILNNDRNLWFPGNIGGYFGADATATSGYQPYKTLFQVYSGYELADGTEELIPEFTGFLVDYNLNPSGGYIEFTLRGYEEKLLGVDAQTTLSTAFTNEAMIPAAGDGSNKDFYTTSEGVIYLLSNGVKIDAVTMLEGIEYTISNTGVPGEGAKVTFATAPALGAMPTASGRAGAVTQKIETLIEALCDTAGISSGERSIENVLFPNGVNGYKERNSQSEWESGAALQNITTTLGDRISKAWILIDDFASGTMEDWVRIFTSFSGDAGSSVSAASGALVLSSANTTGDLYGMCVGITNFTKRSGTWRWRMELTGSIPNPDLLDTGFYFLRSGPGQGYGLVFKSHTEVVFRKRNSAASSDFIDTPVKTGLSAGMHDYRVTRDEEGNFDIYIDGYLYTSTSDSDFFEGYPRAEILSYYSSGVLTIDDFWVSDGLEPTSIVTDDPAIYTTEEFDILTLPKAWGVIEKNETLNNGTIRYYVASHAAPGEAYADGEFVEATPQIMADLYRYFKIRVTITPATDAFFSPHCELVRAWFTTSEIFLALANFTGMSCHTAIQKLAKLCNYEWGFDGSGNFFFRSKDASTTPDFYLDQKDVVRINSVKPGWNEVLNVAKISYAQYYYRQYDSSSTPEDSPTSQDIYGDRIKTDTASDFLLANDADLASGAAQVIHEDNYRARLRVSATFRMIPHMELSDTIQLNYTDDPLNKDYIFGDRLQKMGAGFFGEAGNDMLFRNKLFKVVALNKDKDNETMDLTLEEII